MAAIWLFLKVLDPRVWILVAVTSTLCLGVGFAAGYMVRYTHSVSTKTYEKEVEKRVAATAHLAAVNEMGKAQEADNARKESVVRSTIAADAVRARADLAISASREQTVRKELDKALPELRTLRLADSVRRAYDAGAGGQASPPAYTSGIRPASGETSTTPLMADVYVETCQANALRQNALADRYERLYTIAKSYERACTP